MNEFELDRRLQADCHVLGEVDAGLLLLFNNALLPWFILVPRTQATELYQLDSDQQLRLWQEVNRLSKFIDSEFEVEKLNVAAIGNMVSQLHVHVVGRHSNDYCWPGVVWGAEGREDYRQEQLGSILTALENDYPGRFVANPV
jgi:diadenosine tetraphosphate (Ap4A) HIT family hydrolase